MADTTHQFINISRNDESGENKSNHQYMDENDESVESFYWIPICAEKSEDENVDMYYQYCVSIHWFNVKV